MCVVRSVMVIDLFYVIYDLDHDRSIDKNSNDRDSLFEAYTFAISIEPIKKDR